MISLEESEAVRDIELRNAANFARWQAAWFAGGGKGFGYRAKNLKDLRDEGQLVRGDKLMWRVSQARAWIQVHMQLDRTLRKIRGPDATRECRLRIIK